MKTPVLLLRRMRGVSLMELLVVIAVLGTLAAIAVPSYRRYLIRSQRSEAKIALMQVQTAQEKFYLQNNTYTNSITGGPGVGLGMGTVSETGKYDIAITTFAADGQSYVATASPRSGGGQTDDVICANFTINERGTRGISGTGAAETCWK
jgi:type IV pilus assembly protein PilE